MTAVPCGLLLSCSPPKHYSIVPTDLPEEVTHIGGIFESGGQSTSTGLIALDSRASADLVLEMDDPDRAILAGYALETLQISYPPMATLEQGLIHVASGDSAKLPTPNWHAEVDVDDSDLRMTASDEPLALTSDWLNLRCSGEFLGSGDCPERKVAFEVACESAASEFEPVSCEAVARVDGCSLTMDLDGCEMPVVEAAFESESSLCFQELDGCQWAGRDTALGSLTCTTSFGTCQARIHEVPLTSPWEVVDRLSLLEGARAKAPTRYPERAALLQAEVTIGYLAGLSPSEGDNIAIVDYLGAYPEVGEARPEGRLRVLDRRTLSVVDTATLADSVSWVGSDGDLSLIGFEKPARLGIKQVGRPIQILPISQVQSTTPNGLVVAGPFIVVSYFEDSLDNGTERSHLALFDRETRALVDTINFEGADIRGLRLDQGTQVWLTENNGNESFLVDVATRATLDHYPYLPAAFTWASWTTLRDSRSGNAVALTVGGRSSIHVFEQSRQVSRQVLFEVLGELTAALDVGSGHMALGATGRNDRTAYFSGYDVEEHRYELGALPIGFGPVAMLYDDNQGGTLAVLPWSAEVVRVRRR